MALPILGLLGGLFKNPIVNMVVDKTIGAVQHNLEKKKIIRAAEIEAAKTIDVAKIQADMTVKTAQVNASTSSWKDEWLTILFSIPMIMAFIPGGIEVVERGFAALETMPEWYQYTVSVIVAASFGVRSAIGFMKAKK